MNGVEGYRSLVRKHYLAGIECLHDEKQDVSRCGWGDWQSAPQPSVGAAVEAWLEHVDSFLHDAPPLRGSVLS